MIPGSGISNHSNDHHIDNSSKNQNLYSNEDERSSLKGELQFRRVNRYSNDLAFNEDSDDGFQNHVIVNNFLPNENQNSPGRLTKFTYGEEKTKPTRNQIMHEYRKQQMFPKLF